jgi:hypothetical protein
MTINYIKLEQVLTDMVDNDMQLKVSYAKAEELIMKLKLYLASLS